MRVSLYGIFEFYKPQFLCVLRAHEDSTLNQRVGIATITLNKLEAEEGGIDRWDRHVNRVHLDPRLRAYSGDSNSLSHDSLRYRNGR